MRLHPATRIPLFALAAIAVMAALWIGLLASANGWPLALLWRAIAALGIGAIAIRLALKHVAPPA